MTDAPVVTVDGPSGTGKGTLCGYIATRLGWHFLDSGALYRAVALAALRRGLSLDDGAAVAALARKASVHFQNGEEPGLVRTLLDGEDVSDAIRSEECGQAASEIAARPQVRQCLLEQQRNFRRPPGLVADGRDMGTVVFPGAGLKLFLTASPEIRAQRRHKQLNEKGIDVSLLRLSADIKERDTRDQERSVSPLRPADDAVVIDTSHMGVAAVRAQVEDLIRDRFSGIV